MKLPANCFLWPRKWIITEPRTTRSISAEQLGGDRRPPRGSFADHSGCERALDYVIASARPEDAIFITGSLYLVGQLRGYWKTRAQVAADSETQ